ncbi:MAG: HAD family phosphatase [Nanoarchaeota archaeon]|nr:HAD family phosphatase [Nanoarchaeota archaeon]
MKKAVIFDLDGVLVNSIPTHFKKHQEILKKVAGYTLTKEYFYSYCNGQVADEFHKRIVKENHLDPSLIKKLNDLNSRYNKTIFLDKVKTFPYVKTILRQLQKKGIKLAVASSSRKKLVNQMLVNNDIKKYFNHIITGDDVTKTKPDPEIFLLARKRLGIKKSECVVIEDALNGFKAAKKAGIDCIGVATSLSKKQFPKGIKYASDHRRIMNLIKN